MIYMASKSSLSHLPDDQPGQGHASDGADQLDSGPVVDVAVLHCELLGLGLIVVNCIMANPIFKCVF